MKIQFKENDPMTAVNVNIERINCRRSGTRFDLEQDIIIHHKGIKHPSKMKNISITGVIAAVPVFSANVIQVGDTCSLSFCADPNVKSEVYSSRVTRINSSEIALNFLGFIL